MFERKLIVDALFDLYGKLLTDKQYDIMDLYCNMDYSLGEIAEILGISRQAVHDTVKKTEKALERYEEKIGMRSRLIENQQAFKSLLEAIECFEKTGDVAVIKKIKETVEQSIDSDA